MIKKLKKTKFPSELRFDPISRNWVVIATGRAKKPEMFKREKRLQPKDGSSSCLAGSSRVPTHRVLPPEGGPLKEKVPKKFCPFCHIETQETPILIFNKGKKVLNLKDWTTIVVPNKFPAFLPQPKWEKKIEANLYQTMNAVGFCELVITRDHEKSLARLPIENVKEVLDSYQERYLGLMDKPFVNHISIFHNQGFEAGASIYHPHSQIITTPLIDVDLKRTLFSSENYYKKTKKCIYCQMNDWERKVKKRIVFENRDFLVICPFASKAAFEMIISPKSHSPYFERITEKEKWLLSEAFKMALNKLYMGLNDPPYNFYLHTAPCGGKNYDYYHWHWTILPKTGTWAGFELGARMEISTIEPEKAATYLRKQ